MANFFVMIFLGLIGSKFGPVGFWLGIVIGIIFWVRSNKNKTKASPESNTQDKLILDNSILHTTDQTFTNNYKSGQMIASNIICKEIMFNPNIEQMNEYNQLCSDLYTRMLSFDSSNDGVLINEVSQLIRNDNWISDKVGVLNAMAMHLPVQQAARKESAMLFLLQGKALIERLIRLPAPMRARITLHLEDLSAGKGGSKPKDCIDNMLEALRTENQISKERQDAETIIARSGDQVAISTLKEMRRNPARYKEMLKSGATGNTVLKTALGVFAGLIAMEAVKAAVTDHQKNELLTQLDKDIAEAGGLENMAMQDEELDSMAPTDSIQDAASSFEANASSSDASEWTTGAGNAQADDANDWADGEVGQGSDSSEEADASFADVEVADAGSDFSFDFFD
jgi:hypothetical protein